LTEKEGMSWVQGMGHVWRLFKVILRGVLLCRKFWF